MLWALVPCRLCRPSAFRSRPGLPEFLSSRSAFLDVHAHQHVLHRTFQVAGARLWAPDHSAQGYRTALRRLSHVVSTAQLLREPFLAAVAVRPTGVVLLVLLSALYGGFFQLSSQRLMRAWSALHHPTENSWFKTGCIPATCQYGLNYSPRPWSLLMPVHTTRYAYSSLVPAELG
ncbi:hypothetical protein FKP32DRAFT_212178 [Trametes sanguinea]|nr:hypothetical protein FKP32DRAFT_212178 [Trametes sanguinea]